MKPFAAEWDEKKHFPKDQYKKAADLGFAGIYVSEEAGGCGLGRLESSLIFEGLSTGNIMNKCDINLYRMRWIICLYKYSQYGSLDD